MTRLSVPPESTLFVKYVTITSQIQISNCEMKNYERNITVINVFCSFRFVFKMSVVDFRSFYISSLFQLEFGETAPNVLRTITLVRKSLSVSSVSQPVKHLLFCVLIIISLTLVMEPIIIIT